MTPQMRKEFEEDLASIRDKLLRMGSLLDQAIVRSMAALDELDESKAREVVTADEQINVLRFEVEDLCVASIARQQPAARDLRHIVAALNIVLDLERIGDYAAGIAKTVLRLNEEHSGLAPPPGLFRMKDLARAMLKEVMSVYAEANAERAKGIAAQDDTIDEQYRTLFRELLDLMADHPEASERALYLMFAGHNLERIADRVTNVAERIVFMDSGEMQELNVESVEPEGV